MGTIQEIGLAVSAAEKDDTTRVIIITGSGKLKHLLLVQIFRNSTVFRKLKEQASLAMVSWFLMRLKAARNL
jgi:enoyl-CoA hydratase/carnithine racemase